MPRRKILWLCSWYPNRVEPFNGDFIQRHAKAASLYDDIYVIHVAGYNDPSIQYTERSTANADGLVEEIILFRRGGSFLEKARAQYRWLQLCKSAIQQYIAVNGKPDAVHVHVPLKAGLAASWMKKKYGIPYVLTEHWGIYNDKVDDSYAKRSALFKRLVKKVVEGAATFVSVSNYLAAGVNRMVTKKEYTLVVNTVDTSLFHYTTKTTGVFRFIHVSNMVPLKNTEGILRAFKRLRTNGTVAELILVGDTDTAIRDMAKDIGLTEVDVQFRGEVAYAQVAGAMQAADCFILFSNIENSPCVICEALCTGLPVIASRVGGVPELVDGSNSILVEAGDENQLAGAMQDMIENYADFNRKKIAENANGKFSYPVIGKKISALYDSNY